MPSVRGWPARALDALAVLIVLYALFHFFVEPRVRADVAVPAPPVRLATLDGRPFSLAAHRGRVVFLDFWASWCGPCKLSLPLVEHYARSHSDVDVIAVDVGEDAPTVGDFARAHQLRNVVLDPDQIAAHAFGIDGFPTMVVVDPAGLIRAKWTGFNPAIELAMADARTRYRKPAAAAAATIRRPPVLAIGDDPNTLATIAALRNPKTAVPDTAATSAIAGYAVPRPDTPFLSEGANDPFSILPRHIGERYVSLDRSSLDADPVGLGPFRLTR